MEIILFIFGTILAIIGLLAIPCSAAIKNQKNWDDFYKYAQEQNSSISNYPEEVLYKIICKMNYGFITCLIIGLLLIILGIVLVIMKGA